MSLGTALLQPDTLRRAAPDLAEALMEDVARLVAVFIEDAAASGPLAGAGRDALEDLLPRLQAEVTPRLQAVIAKLRARFGSALNFVSDLVGQAESLADDPTAILGLIRTLLADAKALIAALSLPGLRSELAFVRGLLMDDLLLGPEFLRQVVLWYVDALLARLNALPLAADLAKARRLILARALLTHLRVLVTDLPMPTLDVESMARAIDLLIRQSGLADALAQISCALDGISAAMDAATAIGQTIRPTPQPVGAGVVPLANSMDYSYYGSWLLNSQDIPLLGISDIKQQQSFIGKLKTGTDEMSVFLRGRLRPEDKQVLDGYANTAAEAPRDVMLGILAGVNRLMQTIPVLEGNDDINLSAAQMNDDLRAFQRDYQEDQSLLLFNRRVLEAAYPAELETFPGGFSTTVEGIFLPLIGWARNQVFVTGDRRFVMCDDKPLHAGTNVQWNDAPLFSEASRGAMWFQFQHASPRACEILTWILFMAAEAGKSVWHMVALQPNHEVQTGLVFGIEVADTIQQLLFGRPVSAYFLESNPHARRWGKSLDSLLGLKGIATFASSFQGMHTAAPAGNGFTFWLTVISGDLFRVSGPVQMINALRDITLAIVTLINFRGPQDAPSQLPPNPSRNRAIQGPIVSLADTLMAMALISVSPRDDYSIELWGKDGIASRRAEMMAGHWLGGSAGFGVLAGMSGSLVAQIFAWAEDYGLFFKTAGISAGKMFLMYWLYNYLFKENTTDGGKYRPGGGTFRGYPDKANAASPYRLPFPGGTGRYVSQGNLGLWSHNFISNQNFVTPASSSTQQTYAYDFGHDFQEPIACARAGTVVAFTESNVDSSTANPNRIVIKHATIDAEHDNFGSGAVQTYSVYLHLAQNGVTNAPRFAGVPTIIGTAVAQGDLIALAGDTGKSFHNHLHLHVVPDDGAGNPSGVFAIPFVFDDVSGDGVPKSLTWYRSGNA